MSFIKIKNLEDQLSKIKMFLPEYIKEKLNVDIAGGKKILCLNPEHNDTNPSMSMFKTSNSTPLLKCHSCSAVVDIFSACHILESRPIVGPGFIDDTVVYLSKKYDIPLEIAKMSEEDIYEMNIINMYKSIHTYITSQPLSALHIAELEKRGWSPTFACSIGIGVCYDIQDLRDYLKGLGYSYKFMDENDLYHSRIFNPNTLIFTLFDEHGRPVSFSARNLIYDGIKDSDGRFINGTKFINSSVNPKCGIGKKNEILYLFNIAKTKTAPIYVFEGNADVATAHSAGLTNSVAICGLGLNDTHLNMFRRNSIYDIVVCLDGDEPGQNKAKQILDDALKKVHDIKIRFIFLPEKEIVTADGSTVYLKYDPDEYIRDNGLDAFLRLPKIDPFSWRLQQFDFDENAGSESICLSMVPIIANDPSAIKRETMIKDLSIYTGISEKSIRDEVNRIVNADDIKISKAKKSILDEVINQLSSGEVSGMETILSSAIDKLYTIDKQFSTSILDTSSRISDLLNIKNYQESEDGFTKFNFGNDYSTLNLALNGDLGQKLILVGGSANSGKTSFLSNLSVNLPMLNEDTMCIYLTIDDARNELLPRIISYLISLQNYSNHNELFESCNINKMATPYLYKDNIEYSALMEERHVAYQTLLNLANQDKFILLDSEHGKSLEFIQTIAKSYKEKYPNRKIFIFIDNIHLITVPQYDESRQKYKYLSHEIKALAVKFGITIIGTIEYRKIPAGIKPSNSDIAEAKIIGLLYSNIQLKSC